VALSLIDKSFAGSRGGFSKEPLEIVKGTKRVRFVGWAGLKKLNIYKYLTLETLSDSPFEKKI
jgi:hypothetical protein